MMIIARMTRIFGFFLAIFLKSATIAVPWNKFDIYSVDACPGNKSKWEEASMRLNCTMKSKDFKNRYHCLATRDRTRLVEFCYPRTRSIFGKGQCVIFDASFSLDNYTCLHFSEGCPDSHYYTDQLYKYPYCFRIEPDVKCFISDEFCLMRNRITTVKNEEVTSQNVKKRVAEGKDLDSVLVLIFILLGLFLGILLIALIRLLRRPVIKFWTRIHLRSNEHNVNSDVAESLLKRTLNNTNLREEHDGDDESKLMTKNVIVEKHKKPTEDLGKELQQRIEKNRKVLSDFQRKVSPFFVKTRTYEKVINALNNQGYIFVKGNSGAGKTTIAKHILFELEQDGMDPLEIFSIKDIEPIPMNSKIAIFIDNLFGIGSLLRDELHDFEVRQEILKATVSKEDDNGNVLIMTIRNDIYKECTDVLRYNDLINSSVIDISDEQNQLNRKELEDFVEKYSLQQDVPDLNNLQVKNLGNSVGIPQCFTLLRNKLSPNMDVQQLFTDTPLFLQKQIESRIKEKEVKTVALVYLLLCGGSISIDTLERPSEDVERKYKAMNIIGIRENSETLQKLNHSSEWFKDVFVIRDDIEQSYRISHSSVQESFFQYLCQYFSREVFSSCDPSLLVSLSSSHTSPNKFTIEVEIFSHLIERIRVVISEMKTVSAFKSISLMELWANNEFTDKFMKNKECVMAMRDSFDARDDSMLVHFSKAGNAKMVAFLLHNSPEKEIYKSLNKACSYNHVDVVDMLLKTGVVYDLKTCFYAVQSGNAEMLFRFTENVDVYQTEFSNHPNHLFLKVSLLHEICLLGQNQLINRVIEHYPSVLDVQNSQGGNALHFVAYAGQKDAFITLIQNGSDPYSRSHHGSTVLHYACQNGKLDLVKYICDKYPDLLTEEFDDYHGRSSLHWAAQSGNIELYKYLLKKDASLSIMFCQDNPIGMACLNGKLEMCKYLVKYHSKLFECKMRNGYKVLHQAAWAGNVDIFKCMFHEVLDIECKTDSGKTVLHMCCMNGKVDMCKYLLANYPDLVKIIDNDGWTVLLQAAWGGNIEIFELLIKEGLDVNSTTNQGETVLHLCCLSGKYKMCTYLVNKHPDLVKKNDFRGFNVLHSAAWGGNINIFKNLMERGLDVKGTSNYGHTAVHESSMNGNFQLCKYLVKNYLELVEVIDNNGESVLHKAAFAGNVDIFKLLVDKRLDITSTTNEGKTVLHLCCMNGNLQMCKYLASNYPCVVNIIDNDGMTALHCAAFGGNVEIFKFLNQKRLDAENTSDQGKTVVHWCCRKGTLGMCKYLVNNYQHLFEFKDNDGLTVLHDAAWGGDVGIFRFLISNGLDVNSKTNAGKTVLHYCCRNGKLELCRYLVQIHPELVKCMDSDGRNLLHDAAWGGNVDIFKFLIQIGLDVEITTYIGKTVMHESCLNGKRELFKHLVNNYSGLLKINDNKGESVLHDAAWGGNIDILKLLIEKGLEVKSTTDVGETVLHRCCRNGQSQMCSFLVKNYPYLIKIDDIEGKNVLHDAAFGGNIYVLKLLLSKGLDIKSTTAVGKTVLHQCCMSNNFQMCKYLVNAHPELVSISDNDGKNVLHDAARGGNVDVFRFLKEKNLDVKKTTNKGKTALHYCCKNGKLQMCRYLINDQPDLVQIVDSSGINVLHETARGGNVKILKFLLDKGIDVKNTSFTGKTILHFCCKKGQKEMLKYVISKYPSLVKSIDNDGCNLLHDAACGGNIDIFKLLIKHNLDVKSKTNKGKTVLHLCCKNGWIGLCLYLVENYHCLIKLSDNKGKTALHDAAWGGNIDVFKVLTKQNIDVTNTTNTGKTILHFCCMNGKLQMCKFLVKNYPFLIEKIDNDGETLLHSSAWGGNVYLFKFLIGKGLNVNSKTKEGKTVLHMCCMNGKVQMCKYIVENHPDLVRISDYGRKTVLHEAAWGGNIKVFKLLIDEGLDVYDKTNKGKTVLHKCCINGKVQICEYLVSHQPQLLTVQDNDGLNALHDTAIGGNVELFKFLLEKGLDVHSKTGSGQTVLHLCCHVGCHVDKQAMFDYLIESYPDLLYVVDNECNTVLHVACAQNQTKICSSLVDKFPDLLNIKNKNGEKVVVCLVEGKRQFKMKKRTLGTNFFRKFLLQ